MRNSLKRVLGILACMGLVFSLFMSVFAFGEGTISAGTVEIGNVIARPGKTVKIPITLKKNPGVLGVEFDLSYPEQLIIENIERGKALSSMEFAHSASLSKNPITLAWDAIDADYENGVIANLSVHVPEGTEEGDYNFAMEIETIFNDDAEIAMNMISGGVTVIHYTPGDANGDGRINTRDTVALRRYIAGGYDIKVVEPALDANEDGRINSRDVVYVRNMVVS